MDPILTTTTPDEDTALECRNVGSLTVKNFFKTF